MTIEDKAKAYDKAMNIAKKIINDVRKGKDILVVYELETMFPELKESEDEKMRKALIRFFQRFPYDRLNDENLKPEDAIAWLEKQSKVDNVKK